MSFPLTQIGGIPISRLIIGSNTFHGFSHFSAARDQWLRQYFTPERIYEVLEVCAEAGLNATVAGVRPDYRAVLDELERNTGHHIVYIGTPGGRDLEELKAGIRQAADLGCEMCWPHTSWTDARLVPSENRIVDAPEVLAYIRQCGMIPGWSTHRPETVTISDKAGYDVEGYIQIYNAIGFLCAVETDWTARVIQNTPKPCVCIKPLASGRVMPPTGLNFVYSTIKPIDTVAIGMMSPQEAREDIAIALACLERVTPEVELQYTRSKADLVGAA